MDELGITEPPDRQDKTWNCTGPQRNKTKNINEGPGTVQAHKTGTRAKTKTKPDTEQEMRTGTPRKETPGEHQAEGQRDRE